MHCFYSYDTALDLYALTVSESSGRQWVVVMDLTEFEALAAGVAASPWLATQLDLGADALRDLLHQVTGRDPDDW
jgi:hypothetical protein